MYVHEVIDLEEWLVIEPSERIIAATKYIFLPINIIGYRDPLFGCLEVHNGNRDVQ